MDAKVELDLSDRFPRPDGCTCPESTVHVDCPVHGHVLEHLVADADGWLTGERLEKYLADMAKYKTDQATWDAQAHDPAG